MLMWVGIKEIVDSTSGQPFHFCRKNVKVDVLSNLLFSHHFRLIRKIKCISIKFSLSAVCSTVTEICSFPLLVCGLCKSSSFRMKDNII